MEQEDNEMIDEWDVYIDGSHLTLQLVEILVLVFIVHFLWIFLWKNAPKHYQKISKILKSSMECCCCKTENCLWCLNHLISNNASSCFFPSNNTNYLWQKIFCKDFTNENLINENENAPVHNPQLSSHMYT